MLAADEDQLFVRKAGRLPRAYHADGESSLQFEECGIEECSVGTDSQL